MVLPQGPSTNARGRRTVCREVVGVREELRGVARQALDLLLCDDAHLHAKHSQS